MSESENSDKLEEAELDLYQEKFEWFDLNFEGKRTAAADFYRDVFPEGSFEHEVGKMDDYPKTGKGNGFLIYENEQGEKHHRFIFDDLAEIQKYSQSPYCTVAPVSFFGATNTTVNAREAFGIAIDLDNVGAEEANLLFNFWIYQKRIPNPTYTVISGNGLHLYFLFEQPLKLYENVKKQLKQLKHGLTAKIWNGDTSRLKKKQFQPIIQGYRVVGGKSKKGYEILAYHTGEKTTVAKLNEYVSEEFQVQDICYRSYTGLTLAQAKEKFPEWYEERIVKGRKKSAWTCKRALYDWWLRQADKAEFHHRYFFVMSLCIYALKCNVDYQTVKADALGLLPLFNDPKRFTNPFTREDIECALELYRNDKILGNYKSFPRDEIERITAIDIPKNKRNGRPQKQHLEGARALQSIKDKYDGTNWRSGNGRKSYREAVFKFLDCNPYSTVTEFCELTNMSRRVFFKYKKEYDSQQTRSE